MNVVVVRCLMIVAMDLNASPVPEEDEDIFEEEEPVHVQQFVAPEERIESGADIARRVLFLIFLFFIPSGFMAVSVYVGYAEAQTRTPDTILKHTHQLILKKKKKKRAIIQCNHMCWCHVIVGHLDTSITSVGAMVLWNRSNMMVVSYFFSLDQ